MRAASPLWTHPQSSSPAVCMRLYFAPTTLVCWGFGCALRAKRLRFPPPRKRPLSCTLGTGFSCTRRTGFTLFPLGSNGPWQLNAAWTTCNRSHGYSLRDYALRVRRHQEKDTPPEDKYTQVLREGKELQDESMWEDALSSYTNAINSNPIESRGYVARGRLYFALSKFTRAKNDFEQACKYSPQNIPSYVAKAQCHAAMGHYENALRQFDEAIAIDQEYAPAHVGRANIILQAQQQVDVHKVTRVKEEDADSEAMASYHKAIKLDKKLHSPWVGIGNVAIKRGHFEEAKRAFEEALERALTYVPGEVVEIKDHQTQVQEIYGSLGVMEELQGNNKKAIELFSQGLSIAPESFLFAKRAASYLISNDFPSGIEDARKAIQLDPDNHTAYLMLGQGLMNTEEYEQAQEALETFMEEEKTRQTKLEGKDLEESKKQLAEVQKLHAVCKQQTTREEEK